MNFTKRLLPEIGLCLGLTLASAVTASAAPLDTFTGTASFSDTSPIFNNPVFFIGDFAQPTFSFAPTAVGQTYTDQLTVVGTDAALGSFSDQVAVALNFTLPNSLGGTIGGTGSETESFVFAGLLSYFADTGTITFAGPQIFAFADGSVLTASMANISLIGLDGVAAGAGNLTLTLTKVPEPTTLALFGFGLIALGWFATRRKFQALTE